MSPDAAAFTDAELYVLERGTITVFSLPDMVRRRSFGGSGSGRGQLSPRHQFDQGLRVTGGRILAEDEDTLLEFSPAGQCLRELDKPRNTTWFVPARQGYVAKSLAVTGSPPVQHIRVVLYDANLREVRELYRQVWFQQLTPGGFTTELPGDLVHFAVVRDRICIETSPAGFVIEVFDLEGRRVSTWSRPFAQVPMTPADQQLEMTAVRAEKRVAAMVARAGSWEALRRVWGITFPAAKPAVRELQAHGDLLLARTFERRDGRTRFVLLDSQGELRKEWWLPEPTDAETEARVSGTAFFSLVGDWFYYLRLDPQSKRWEVHRVRP